MDFNILLNNQKVSNEELLNDLKEVSSRLRKKTITKEEYNQEGKYKADMFSRRFNSWHNALEQIGLVGTTAKKHVSEHELFDNLQNIWEQLGRQPIAKDIKKPLSKFAGNTYLRRFGGWNNALIAFGDYMNQKEDISEIEDDFIEESKEEKTTSIKHKTKRTISDRLRFSILMRDGFTCQSCGRSPTTERGVELHVDHILPWSKGGETEKSNLQTKCKKCNLGKGNAFDK